MAESFEKHMRALEDAVQALESGDQDLERSLEIYEGAVAHLKSCHAILEKAEARVKTLTEDLDEEDLDPEGGA